MNSRWPIALALLTLAAWAPGCTTSQGEPSAAEVERAAASNSPWVGRTAPLFSLLDHNEQSRRLEDYRGQWVVLYFYPKDDTPGCRCQATEFTDLLQQFRDMNAVVLGVSPDSTQSHQMFRQRYGLQLTLLSDPGAQVTREYDAWRSLGGEESVGRVVRSTFLIDPQGVVAWHWPQVVPQGHAERVRQKLSEVRKGI